MAEAPLEVLFVGSPTHSGVVAPEVVEVVADPLPSAEAVEATGQGGPDLTPTGD